MTLYCKVGDKPTLYYQFSGQSSWAKISFGMAPIDVVLEPVEEPPPPPPSPLILCYPNGTPAIGTMCRLRYQTWMDWWTSDPSAIGEGGTTGAGGGGPLPPDALKNIGESFYSANGWEYSEFYVETTTTIEDEDGIRYKYYFARIAWKDYSFNGLPPTEKPPSYEALGDSAEWGFLSDSCGWSGDSNCSMSPPPPPPPPPPPEEKEERLRLKVLFNNQTAWQKEGKPPCQYRVVCGEGCPPGFIKCRSGCVPCSEFQSDLVFIQSLLRK